MCAEPGGNALAVLAGPLAFVIMRPGNALCVLALPETKDDVLDGTVPAAPPA